MALPSAQCEQLCELLDLMASPAAAALTAAPPASSSSIPSPPSPSASSLARVEVATLFWARSTDRTLRWTDVMRRLGKWEQVCVWGGEREREGVGRGSRCVGGHAGKGQVWEKGVSGRGKDGRGKGSPPDVDHPNTHDSPDVAPLLRLPQPHSYHGD